MASNCAKPPCENLSPAGIVSAFQASKMSSLSALTLLLYDFILTFNSEVSMIWGARLGLGKILFLTVRYYSVISLIVINTILLLPNASEEL
ncbi:hypothetical protein PNOK_0442200 [Pyrrhoderma noxium]|uniref:DUF6533 domain-containing protein n=1 Tax=Pyrrhoderma noxium TaxID=2282107 RepID=A0A286UIV0_9AGAM|nr:hypothetical protein PNOK_0442200 [Pyrrhoderma noxium]